MADAKVYLIIFFLTTNNLWVVGAWDSIDLELFDLVEEIKDNFYEVLGVKQSASQAEIRRAYRKLSLQLHPDKNKEPDAEIKFRRLVAVSDVLRDEEKRKRYDNILRDGLPDWRMPVYYYRRVRKMGLFEFIILLFFILTIGHYLVAWSIYLEKKFEMEEFLFSTKKKRDKKAKKAKQAVLSDEDITELAGELVQGVGVSRPVFTDLLPFKMVRGLKSLCVSLPDLCQELIQYLKEKRKEKEEESDEEETEEDKDKPVRPRRRQRIAIPEASDEAETEWEGAPVVTTQQALPVEESKTMKEPEHKSDDWSEQELSHLIRAMAKFPGGTVERWEKIAEEVGRPVAQVIRQVKDVRKSYVAPSTVSPQASVAGKDLGRLVPSKKQAVTISDTIATKSESDGPDSSSQVAQDIRPNTVGTQPAGHSVSSEDEASSTKSLLSAKNSSELSKPTSAHSKQLERTTAKNEKQKLKAVSVSNDTNNLSVIANSKTQISPQSAVTDGKGSQVTEVVSDVISESTWTQIQQKQLEQAMALFPKTHPDRWTCIANAVPGKTKGDCISRCKFLAERVRQKKQLQQGAKDS